MDKENHIAICINEASKKVPGTKELIVKKVEAFLVKSYRSELTKSDIQKVSRELVELQLGELEKKGNYEQ